MFNFNSLNSDQRIAILERQALAGDCRAAGDDSKSWAPIFAGGVRATKSGTKYVLFTNSGYFNLSYVLDSTEESAAEWVHNAWRQGFTVGVEDYPGEQIVLDGHGQPLGNARGFLVLSNFKARWVASISDTGACREPKWEA